MSMGLWLLRCLIFGILLVASYEIDYHILGILNFPCYFGASTTYNTTQDGTIDADDKSAK